MNLLIYNASVYDSDTKSFFHGAVASDGEKISKIYENVSGIPAGIDTDSFVCIDAEQKLLIPGLIDIHTHGRAGGDFNSADLSLMRTMAKSYLSSGVTTVMPTLASAPMSDLTSAISIINELSEEKENMPYIAGVHLEGRYLNPAKRGAHSPDLLASLDATELDNIIPSIKGVCRISAAFELDTDGSFMKRALDLGAMVSLGHTCADYKTTVELIKRGLSSITHLFNAMPPLHHRDGGAVCAGLTEPVFCELICDGFHIAPEMIGMSYRLAGYEDRIVLISDSMEATGCADGEYTIAGMPVTVSGGRARTHDGAIAGSTLSLWDGVLNLKEFACIPLERAIYCATMAPARAAGIAHLVGSITEGKRADMLLVDRKNGCRIDSVYCGGQASYLP